MIATPVELGGRLRTSRQHTGLSQRAAAAKAGLPQTSISDIERGVRRIDCLELAALAALYDQPLDYFLGTAPRALSRPEQLIAQLETMTSDLGRYVEQRARELAEPVIELAERTAARDVAVACGERDRERLVVAELRHHRTTAIRRAHRAEHQAGPVHHRGEDCEQCTQQPERTPHP